LNDEFVGCGGGGGGGSGGLCDGDEGELIFSIRLIPFEIILALSIYHFLY